MNIRCTKGSYKTYSLLIFIFYTSSISHISYKVLIGYISASRSTHHLKEVKNEDLY